MKILITGAAGYVGTELVAKLAQNNKIENIIVYDNFSRSNFGLFTQTAMSAARHIRVVKGDILDSRTLGKIIPQVDAVIHLAAIVPAPYKSIGSHTYDQINNWGTAELVYAIEKSPVKKLIHLSTSTIYGQANDTVDEKSIPVPSDSYGLSKLRGEEHVQRIMKKGEIPTIILRSGNTFGFSQSIRFETVINRFVFDAKYLNKIYVHGKGTQARAFIGIKALTKVIEKALLDGIQPGIYNVFTDNVKIIEIADIMKKIYPDLDIQYLNQHVKYGSIKFAENEVISDLLSDEKDSLEERIKKFSEGLSF